MQEGNQAQRVVGTSARTIDLFIPVRNGEHYLAQCIESILRQSFSGWRLTILDNRSTDGTARVAAAFLRDPRVAYSLNEVDVGSAGNFNQCLNLVQGEFYAILSHDDFFRSRNALGSALEAMDAHPEINIVYSDVEWVDHHARSIFVKRMPFRGRVAGTEVSKQSLVEGRNHFGVPVLVRSRMVEGLSYDPRFPLTGDIDFSIACAERAPAYFLPFPAVAIRFHASNGTMRTLSTGRTEFEELARKHGMTFSKVERARRRLSLSLNVWKKRCFFFYLDHIRRKPRT